MGRHVLISQRSIFKVCIVGSGPSGFYCAKYLTEKVLGNGTKVKVDILDKMPTPFGLVRYGVAPDHPEVKSVIDQFIEVIF
jgi:NADPH-dependent glutamate synthase beta subunit-like oxidoreductase